MRNMILILIVGIRTEHTSRELESTNAMIILRTSPSVAYLHFP